MTTTLAADAQARYEALARHPRMQGPCRLMSRHWCVTILLWLARSTGKDSGLGGWLPSHRHLGGFTVP